MAEFNPDISIVLLCYNCEAWLDHTISELLALPERPKIIAVDNGSTDGTLDMLRGYGEQVEVVSTGKNIGGAARNLGVTYSTTEFVAFADDDTVWGPGSLQKAVEYFKKYPKLAVIGAKILVGDERCVDPIAEEMAGSPLKDHDGLPGAVLLSFMGGATVLRRKAYLDSGGYERKLFLGGEEELLASEIVRRGGQMRYLDDVVVYHYPSNASAAKLRPYGIRNALWFAWRRRSIPSALKWTTYIIKTTPKRSNFFKGIAGFIKGLPWVIRTRDPLPDDLERQYRILDRDRIGSSSRSYE